MNDATLDKLGQKWLEAKQNEKAWAAERVAIEKQIAAAVGVQPEGTTNHATEAHKFKTVGKMSRSITVKDALALKTEIDDASYQRLLTWKPSVVKKELDFLEERLPDTHKKVLGRLTTKAAKPSVSVEVNEE